jgi:transcriptional regulator with XRE-family HTH domain
VVQVVGGHVGLAIRAERVRRSLSGETVAARAGISRNWLSKVERGTVTPSVEIVRRLALALGVSAGQLLDGPAPPTHSEGQAPPSARTWGTPLNEPIRVVRHDARRAIRLPDSKHFWEILTPDLRGHLQVLWVQIEPEDSTGGVFEHEGEEIFVVLSGEVRLQVGAQEVTLLAGDAATISSAIPHRVTNPGPAPAVFIAACTPPFM